MIQFIVKHPYTCPMNNDSVKRAEKINMGSRFHSVLVSFYNRDRSLQKGIGAFASREKRSKTNIEVKAKHMKDQSSETQ